MTNTLKLLTPTGTVAPVSHSTGNQKSITRLPGWVTGWNDGQGSVPAADNFLRSVWANRCVTIRADNLAAIPWRLVKGDNEDAVENEVTELLEAVNPEMNFYELLRFTEADLGVYRKAFWLKVYADYEEVSAFEDIAIEEFSPQVPAFLQRLNPSEIKVKRDKFGIVGFKQVQDGQTVGEWPRSQVVYFHEYHPTKDEGGDSTAAALKRAVDMEVNAEKYVGDFFKNNALPHVLISQEGTVTPETSRQRGRLWKRAFGGIGNAFRAVFMGNKANAQVISFPLDQLALETVRQEARRNICAIYGVPPAIAGAWEAANYATIKEQRLSMYEDAIIPRSVYIAGVINEELIAPIDPALEFQFLTEELPIMQEGADEKAMRLASLVAHKIITPEVAALELGYEESDVPEPMPVPDFTPSPDNEDDAINDELRAWRNKAYNDIERKGAVQDDFIPHHLPQSWTDIISAQIEGRTERTKITSTFDWLLSDANR